METLPSTIKISERTLTLINVIERGSFGIVYQGSIINKEGSGCTCAVKVIDRRKKKKVIENELKILKRINNPFTVSILTDFCQNQNHFFVLEYMHGDLYQTLKIVGLFMESEASFYLKEVILGIEYLHSENIIHKDITLSNILLDEKGHAKIGDFGLSEEIFPEEDLSYRPGGTVKYTSPEVNTMISHGFEADWWSLGVLFYATISESYPFSQKKVKEMMARVISGNFGLPEYVSHEANNFLIDLLKYPKEDRLGYSQGASAIKRHELFKDTNWDDVALRLEDPPFQPMDFKSNSPTFNRLRNA